MVTGYPKYSLFRLQIVNLGSMDTLGKFKGLMKQIHSNSQCNDSNEMLGNWGGGMGGG